MTSRIALGGLFAALAVVLNHLLAAVPNVELTSLTLFVAGWCLGASLGSAVGAAAAVALSLTNPLGPPGPLLLAAQVVGFAAWGVIGGVGGRFGVRSAPALGAIGFGGTLLFQVLVNLSLVPASGLPLHQVLAAGIAFTIWHLLYNALIFSVMGPDLLRRAGPMMARFAVQVPPVAAPE